YHGTYTAGALAYRNDVDIVFVDRALGSPSDPVDCPKASDVDLEIRLLQRPDVKQAYISVSASGLDKALLDLRRKFGIRVENHSYGPRATASLSDACQLPSLGQLESILGELDAERDAYLRANGTFADADPLILQSAGNDGMTIDDSSSYAACT